MGKGALMLIYFKNELEELPEKYYGDSLFEMPIKLNSCDILRVHYDEMTNDIHCSIGNLDNHKKFEPKYYFHPERDIYEKIYFNLTTANKENLWT